MTLTLEVLLAITFMGILGMYLVVVLLKSFLPVPSTSTPKKEINVKDHRNTALLKKRRKQLKQVTNAVYLIN